MANTTYHLGTTGVGIFHFPHLLTTEEFQGKDTGKFAVSFEPSPEDKERLLSEIDAEWTKFKESEEGKKHKYKYDYANGLSEYKGDEFFKFKMQERIKTRKGDEWVRRVPIFDAKGKEIGAELTSIGSGTRGKIAYELMPYWMNDKNYGVSLRLTGVQIIELREQGAASAASLGFSAEEEGYVHAAEERIETPFDDEGDF